METSPGVFDVYCVTGFSLSLGSDFEIDTNLDNRSNPDSGTSSGGTSGTNYGTSATSEGSLADFLARYKHAIGGHESNHVLDEENPDSNALGRYQFMSDTLIDMQRRCGLYTHIQFIGTDAVLRNGPGPGELAFLNDLGMQEAFMDCYTQAGLEQISNHSNRAVLCAQLAAWHYAGDITDWNKTSAEPWRDENGNWVRDYRSVASYVHDVCINRMGYQF